jgi:hypothetical protein
MFGIMNFEDIIEAAKKAKGEASAADREMLQSSLTGIETALADIASILERDKPDNTAEAVDAIVSAIRAIKITAPEVSVTPTIEVHPSQVVVQTATPNNVINVESPQIQNSITVPPAEVHVHERPAPKVTKVEFEYVGDRIFGATITRG